MDLSRAKVLLTGAAGGIGRAIASELLHRGARVLLVDRDAAGLEAAMGELRAHGDRLDTVVTDLTDAAHRVRLCVLARTLHGGIDTLINNAGVNPFGFLQTQTAGQIDAAFAVNVQAPLHLCRELLGHLQSRQRACIVNVGSVFGAIGYPGYVTYCATKFAMRGFSEALRRELVSTRVSVHYVAPRATRTPINPPAVERMNAELGVRMDRPERVAREIARLVSRGQRAAVIGWPEKLFVRVNALFPALIDLATRKQLPVIERYGLLAGASSPRSEESISPEPRSSVR